jgi:hypothetical protein
LLKIDKNRRKYIEATFSIIYDMEELRDIWRSTAPLYELEEEERLKVERIIKRSKKALSTIEEILK